MNREKFFAVVAPLRTETVEIPGRGEVTVRELTVGERIAFEEAADGRPPAEFLARLVAASAVADDGSPLFTPDDVPAILGLSAAVVTRLGEAANRVNAMTDEAVAHLGKG